MAADSRRISTHVLDQTSGQPAEGLDATLVAFLVQPGAPGAHADAEVARFHAQTQPGSGRIAQWTTVERSPAADAHQSTPAEHSAPAYAHPGDVFHQAQRDGLDRVEWRLELDVEAYWARQGVLSFYRTVTVQFTTRLNDTRGHWHVPVLLGPHGYTTYRGT